MVRFKAITFLVIVVALILAACGAPATEAPVVEEEFASTEAPAATEVPASIEAPVATDTSIPLPSNTPDSISVPTEAPTSHAIACPAESTTATVVKITDENYQEEVLQSPVPVLIHFGAEWVGTSRLLAPTIEAIANDYAASVKVGNVNVDDYPALSDQFGVTQLPTLIVINHGSEQARIVGGASKEEICKMLDQQLTGNP